jgi:hypothetical protein
VDYMVMMTVADYRKRAHYCMMEAARAPDRDGQFQWQVLADFWLMLAEHLDHGESGHNETPAAIAATKSSVVDRVD